MLDLFIWKLKLSFHFLVQHQCCCREGTVPKITRSVQFLHNSCITIILNCNSTIMDPLRRVAGGAVRKAVQHTAVLTTCRYAKGYNRNSIQCLIGIKCYSRILNTSLLFIIIMFSILTHQKSVLRLFYITTIPTYHVVYDYAYFKAQYMHKQHRLKQKCDKQYIAVYTCIKLFCT